MLVLHTDHSRKLTLQRVTVFKKKPMGVSAFDVKVVFCGQLQNCVACLKDF
jgi:hypothetical protein